MDFCLFVFFCIVDVYNVFLSWQCVLNFALILVFQLIDFKKKKLASSYFEHMTFLEPSQVELASNSLMGELQLKHPFSWLDELSFVR